MFCVNPPGVHGTRRQTWRWPSGQPHPDHRKWCSLYTERNGGWDTVCANGDQRYELRSAYQPAGEHAPVPDARRPERTHYNHWYGCYICYLGGGRGTGNLSPHHILVIHVVLYTVCNWGIAYMYMEVLCSLIMCGIFWTLRERYRP